MPSLKYSATFFILVGALVFTGSGCSSNESVTLDSQLTTAIFTMPVSSTWTVWSNPNYAVVQNFTANDSDFDYELDDGEFMIQFRYGDSTSPELFQARETDFTAQVSNISTQVLAGKTIFHGDAQRPETVDNISFSEQYFLNDSERPLLINVYTTSDNANETVHTILDQIQWVN